MFDTIKSEVSFAPSDVRLCPLTQGGFVVVKEALWLVVICGGKEGLRGQVFSTINSGGGTGVVVNGGREGGWRWNRFAPYTRETFGTRYEGVGSSEGGIVVLMVVVEGGG